MRASNETTRQWYCTTSVPSFRRVGRRFIFTTGFYGHISPPECLTCQQDAALLLYHRLQQCSRSPQLHLPTPFFPPPSSPHIPQSQQTTMHPFPTLLFLTPLLPHLSAQKTINVDVGHHGLQYVPSTIVADVGDVVQFTFYNVHSVVQSVPQFPCTLLEGGMYSGIISSCLGCGAAAQRFVHEVGDREAVWFYCALR